MLRTYLFLIPALILSACYTPPRTEPIPAVTGNYVLDAAHASVTWSISHVGLSNYTARFDDIRGTLSYNSVNPELSQVDIHIDPASVSTGLPEFDDTIAFDARYFDAKTHPDIRFVSTSIEKITETTGRITGDLTFRGETRPVTLDAAFNGAGSSFGHSGKTLGFSAKGSLSRSDFGLTYLKSFGVGDVIKLRIETEFNEAP